MGDLGDQGEVRAPEDGRWSEKSPPATPTCGNSPLDEIRIIAKSGPTTSNKKLHAQRVCYKEVYSLKWPSTK